MKNLKELPKLPRGMGSHSYENNGDIRYRKMINGRTISVTGSTLSEVNTLMKEKEVTKSFPILFVAILHPVIFSFQAFVIRWLFIKPSLVTFIAELNFCNDFQSDPEIEVENKLFVIPSPLE